MSSENATASQMQHPELDIVDRLREENAKLKAENKELQGLVDYYTEYFDDFGYDPHAEAWAARAEEGKKRQEEYRKRHEERMALIAANRKKDGEGCK